MDRSTAPESCDRCRRRLTIDDTDRSHIPLGAVYQHYCDDAIYTHFDREDRANPSYVEFERYIVQFVPNNTTLVFRKSSFRVSLHCELPVQLTSRDVDGLVLGIATKPG